MSRMKECTTKWLENALYERNKSSKVGALDSRYQKPSDCWDQLRSLDGLSLSAKCYTLRGFRWTNFGTSFWDGKKIFQKFYGLAQQLELWEC